MMYGSGDLISGIIHPNFVLGSGSVRFLQISAHTRLDEVTLQV